MVFSSIVFLLYFLPVFLITYYLVGKNYKNIVILAFSIFFYAWGAPKFIFVILGTTFIDFHLVKWMSSIENKLKRRLFLTFSVSINLGLLFYFKYSNFFIENINSVLSVFGEKQIIWTKLLLPIGISFYTFETITYVVDVYRGIHKPLKRFWDYQLYIILFPKLIAGPIIRYHELADQITDRTENETVDNRITGLIRFIIGLSKKVLIANHLGFVADQVFGSSYLELGTINAWLGALAYTFQIYFDFSGYSDMAIGIGKMIGFKFPENFNNPYISTSITDFWRRWHMTLGSWFRNYLYIPLGGNKVKSKSRLYFNLWLVFIASGFWHGASWSFIFWGAYHGFFLVMERIFLLKIYERLNRLVCIALTFFIVLNGWVFFRVEKFSDALLFLKKMYAFNSVGVSSVFTVEVSFYFIVATIFAFFAANTKGVSIQNLVFYDKYTHRRLLVITSVGFVLLIVSIASITASDFNPFIYFRF